jgi:hypothetical protein
MVVDGVRRTSQALAALAEALRTTADELSGLAARAEHLKAEIDAGMPLTQAMAAEERPLIISKLVEITDRLHERGGEVRRAEASQLQAEGRTHEQIATAFGVTRQRASALLKASSTERRAPKRPKPT